MSSYVKCIICDDEAYEEVFEPNLGKYVGICNECAGNYRKCRFCGAFYPKKEVKNGTCECCRDY